jgi:hypothetical protein
MNMRSVGWDDSADRRCVCGQLALLCIYIVAWMRPMRDRGSLRYGYDCKIAERLRLHHYHACIGAARDSFEPDRDGSPTIGMFPDDFTRKDA